jgi:class 3 adenylate cyclase
VQQWNTQAGSQNDIYNFGAMPDEVLPIIAGEWTTCNDEVKGIFRRGFSLLQKEISSNVDYAVPCPKQLRNTEKSKFYPRLVPLEKYKEWHFAFYFDTRPFSRSEAMFGLIITIFICVVLSIASLQFSADANRLVLAPVEHMIMTVETIRKNPLIAMRMADDEFRLEEKTRAKLQHAPAHHALQAKLKETCCSSSSGQEPMETVVLEKTIIKLGSLLALGFGEAGAGIIEQNLSHSDSVGVHVMIPGSKVECIIGKAQVNNFSTATEVLQGKVMTFVNQIAEIVHGVVDEYHGAANKNNGDTFLVVWRTQSPSEEVYAEELFSQDEVGTNVRVAPSKSADMSLMAFAKILGAVHRAPVLAAYRAHPGLQQRLDSRCRVSLSFGLHAGWAIEGAVGSEFKIDASYLSPNVSIVSTVEAATKVYDVPILVSQSVVELGSSGMAAKCRLIDRVIIRGSTTPVGLYALDLDFECLTVQAPFDPKIQWNLRQRFKARQVLEIEKTRLLQPEVEIIKEFENNPDICAMRHLYTMEFLQMFHMGFENYTHGEWEVAERFFSDTQSMLSRWSTDGPSSALLRFMEKHNCIAPDGWNGVRELSVGVQ